MMVEIRNLYKSFGEHIVFKDFSLTIKDNEFVAIMGKTGAGKTTILNMIGSLEPFDSGKIIVDGIDISKKKNQRDYLRRTVGFLFQNLALIDKKSVRQNLKIIKKKYRTSISDEKALELVGLRDKQKRKVYTLSGGEQQRVAIARLMIKNCKLILADEPTGSLDSDTGKKVMKLFEKFIEQGKTVIIVTHDPKVAEQCDRIIEI